MISIREASNSISRIQFWSLFERLVERKPLRIVVAVLIVAQVLVWSLIASPRLSLFMILLILFLVVFAISLEAGTLAIILVIPWSWYTLVYSARTIGLPISFRVSYILVTVGFGYLLFRLVIVKGREWVRTPLDVPLLIFLGINLLSITVSIDPLWSLRESSQVALYIMFYFLVTNVLQTKQSVVRAVNVAILATVLAGIVGMSGLMGYFLSAGGLKRMYAGFTGPNLAANYIIMGFPLAFALALEKRVDWGKKLLYTLATGVLVFALLLTYSRAAWIAGIIVALLVCLLAKINVKGFAIVTAIILILWLPCFAPIQQRAAQIGSLDESSNLSHLYLWKAAWHLVNRYPVLGVGAGAFPSFFRKYFGTSALPPPEVFGKRVYWADKGEYGELAHNAFLQMWAELGSLGFFGFLFIVGLFSKTMFSVIRRAKDDQTRLLLIGLFASVVGVLLHNLSITNLIDHFWVILGIATAGAKVMNSAERLWS